MHLHSGRTYSSDHQDIEAKLDLILKELNNLKFRVDGLKNKSNERTLENRNDRRKDERNSRSKINEDDIILKIKIDSFTFDGIFDLKLFSDWIADLDYFFD